MSGRFFYKSTILRRLFLKSVIRDSIEESDNGKIIFDKTVSNAINIYFIRQENLDLKKIKVILDKLEFNDLLDVISDIVKKNRCTLGQASSKSHIKKIIMSILIKENVNIKNLKTKNKAELQEVIIYSLNKKILNSVEKLFSSNEIQKFRNANILIIKNQPIKFFPLFKVFPNVKEIIIENTDLEEFVIDVNFPNLEILRCHKNKKLRKLVIFGGHNNLTKIFAGNNSLIDLNISNCKKLKSLFLNNNNLKKIDVQGCDELYEIFIHQNFLTMNRIKNTQNTCKIYGISDQKDLLRIQMDNCISM